MQQPKHLMCCLSGPWWQYWEASPAVLFIQFEASDTGDLQEQFGIAYYLTTNQSSTLLSSQTLTVKDLLLSNLGQKVRRDKFNMKEFIFVIFQANGCMKHNN